MNKIYVGKKIGDRLVVTVRNEGEDETRAVLLRDGRLVRDFTPDLKLADLDDQGFSTSDRDPRLSQLAFAILMEELGNETYAEHLRVLFSNFVTSELKSDNWMKTSKDIRRFLQFIPSKPAALHPQGTTQPSA